MNKAWLMTIGVLYASGLAHGGQVFAQIVPSFAPASGATYGLSPVSNVNTCADVVSSSSNQGAAVVSGQCLGPSSVSQQWSIVGVTSPVGPGVQVIDKNSGQCLDISGASTTDGAVALQWPCGGASKLNQIWKVSPSVSGYQLVSMNSGKCLNVSSGTASNLEQRTCTSSNTQLWQLNASVLAAPIKQGLYQLAVAALPTVCANVPGSSASAGAAVNTAQCAIGINASQQWKLVPSGSTAASTFQIISQNSGLCVDVSGQSNADGAVVLQWACGGPSKTNQMWQITAKGASYQIVSVNSGKCLNVPLGSGKQLEQRSCNGGTTQLWAASQVAALSSALVTTITALQVTPTQALTGKAVAFTTTVTSSSNAIAGTVSFRDGSVLLATIPVGAQGTASYSTSSLANGSHQITATYNPPTGFSASQSTAVLLTVAQPASGEQAQQADLFVNSVGVNTHFTYTDTSYVQQFPRVLTKLSGSGIRHIRDGFYNWSSSDPIVAEHQALAAAGIATDYVVPIDATTSPSTLTSFATLVGDLESIEATNECDAGNNCGGGGLIGVNHVVSMLPVLSSAATSLRVPLVGPSFTTAYSYASAGNLSSLLTDNNLHVYFGGRNPGTPGWGDGDGRGNNYGSMSWWMAEGSVPAPAKGSMITETGYIVQATAEPYTLPESVEGVYLPRTLLLAFNKGVTKTYVYELLEEGSSPGYGLLRSDLSERPAFTAVSSMLNLLSDRGLSFVPGKLNYVVSGSVQPSHALFQKRDGTFWLALWIERSCYDPINGTPIPTSDIAVSLSVNDGEAIKAVSRFDQMGVLQGQLLKAPTVTTQLSVGDSLTLVQISPL